MIPVVICTSGEIRPLRGASHLGELCVCVTEVCEISRENNASCRHVKTDASDPQGLLYCFLGLGFANIHISQARCAESTNVPGPLVINETDIVGPAAGTEVQFRPLLGATERFAW
jgi:hypothetical protein